MTLLLLLLAAMQPAPTLIDFESATVLLQPGDKANRLEQFEQFGVTFRLARSPKSTRAKGLLMFFEHLATGHKGIGSAMALESIPVRATFPKPASSVTVTFWGSTGVPVRLQAFDAAGNLLDTATLAALPLRKSPADPEPLVPLTVRAANIAAIEFYGPRPGEFLAADEVRFTTLEN